MFKYHLIFANMKIYRIYFNKLEFDKIMLNINTVHEIIRKSKEYYLQVR